MSRNYSFIKTPEEIAGMKAGKSLYTDIKRIHMAWEIDQETYLRLLPPGLEPYAPVAIAFIASFGNAGFHLSAYMEGALLILAQKDGIVGGYCLAMPIQNGEMGILLGREAYGYPKKDAKIQIVHSGDTVRASLTRNGITFFEVEGVACESPQKDPTLTVAGNKFGEPIPEMAYLLDYKANMRGEGPAMSCLSFDDIVLCRQANEARFLSEIPLDVNITMRPSEDDPWIELAPKRIIAAAWQHIENNMLGSEVVKRYEGKDAEAVLPYCFARWDTNIFGKDHDFYF